MDDVAVRALLSLIPGVLILGALLWLLIWVTGDANVRGKPGCLVAILIFMSMPFGLLLWLLVRPPRVKPPVSNRYDATESN